MNSRIASSFCRTGRAGHGLDHRSQGCWLLWRCAAFLTLSSSLLRGTFAARRAEPAGRVAAHLIVRPHDEEERRISSVHDLLPVVLEEGALHTTASAVRRRSRMGASGWRCAIVPGCPSARGISAQSPPPALPATLLSAPPPWRTSKPPCQRRSRAARDTPRG